jgi:DNA (cytosine-5)-methyltransferase 1
MRNDDFLIIDNFAGGGGASVGMEAALGRPVDIAVNHDPVAIAMHRANHPDTLHLCESVWDVDPVKVCKGRPVGLAWFSPDCKHFSKAKGGKPVEKKIRGLAWVVIKWAATVRPRVIMLENVAEFLTWGPLIYKDGKQYPCPKRKGKTYDAFINALKKHGYNVEWRQLRACDYGAPTIRKRLFMIARCDGRPITWPEPTHGDPASEEVKNGFLQPWRTAAECIEWDVLCPSIFERKRPLAENTQRRIAKGIMRYVVNSADPYIVTYYGPKKPGEFRGQSINEPLRTQTTENRHGLVMPSLIDAAHGEVGNNGSRRWGKGHHNIKKPLATVTQKNGHALVSAFLAKHYGGVVGSEVKKPMGTVTTVDHHSLVSANLVRNMGQSVGSDLNDPARTVLTQEKDSLVTSHIVKMKGSNIGQDAREPLHTITAGGTHFGEVRAFLLKYYGTDQDPRLKEPLHTLTTKDRFGLVTVHGEEYKIVDIGMRMLTPRELFRAQGFPDSYIIDRDADGKRITKTQQVAKCGNSVCPDLARVLVEANVVHALQDNEAVAI